MLGCCRWALIIVRAHCKRLISTVSWRWLLSHRNQSLGLLWKSMVWFLYNRDFHHEWVKKTRCCLSLKSNQYFKLLQLNVEKPTVFKVVWNVTLLLNFFIVALITLSALLQIPHTILCFYFYFYQVNAGQGRV